MKCPLKEDNFGRMPDCQPDCAWMVNGVCAVAARYYDVDANDALPPKNDVSTDDVDANDGNDALDSREKLEADVRRFIRSLPTTDDERRYGEVIDLLNRQAAITEREWKAKAEQAERAMNRAAGKWARADGNIAELSREIGTLRAERDRYRELCGKLLDAADEMRRVRDAFDQFERGEA